VFFYSLRLWGLSRGSSPVFLVERYPVYGLFPDVSDLVF